MIYFDNAATTYPKPEKVYTELDIANRNAFNTGRGSYKSARIASTIKENVRDKILNLNNMNGKVVFTCSATIALNDIIFGMDVKENDYIYISPFEHNSIIRPLEELKKRKKIHIEILPFNKSTWEPEYEKINDLFAIHNPKAVFISQVSNVTGYLLPYDLIFESSSKYNSINVLDASQGFGVVPIKQYSNISYVVFAGHKSLYASFGIAGYIKLKNDKLNKRIFGGTGSDTMNPEMTDDFPDGYEAGSPNIVAIRGLNVSIDWLNSVNIYEHEVELTKYLIQELKNIEKVKVFIPIDNTKIFGVVSIGVEGYSSSDVGIILDDEYDICVRTGYHCAPLIHDFIDSLLYNGTIRVSLGYFNRKEDIDCLIKALKSL